MRIEIFVECQSAVAFENGCGTAMDCRNGCGISARGTGVCISRQDHGNGRITLPVTFRNISPDEPKDAQHIVTELFGATPRSGDT